MRSDPCDCELRNRQWNPLTQRCETCGCWFESQLTVGGDVESLLSAMDADPEAIGVEVRRGGLVSAERVADRRMQLWLVKVRVPSLDDEEKIERHPVHAVSRDRAEELVVAYLAEQEPGRPILGLWVEYEGPAYIDSQEGLLY